MENNIPSEEEQSPIDTKENNNPVIITANSSLSWIRLRNFYMTNAFQWFVWMIFHFSMVFFFTFQLKSVFLVGIFLGFANIIAFFLDIPIGIIQRYYSTKKLFIFWAISQLIATIIFFNFIYSFFSQVWDISKVIVPEWFESVFSWFFWDVLNWILILVASFCYWLTKEINDISTFWYILSHANPSEYSKILARNNITYWLGSLTWLVLSGIILSINPTFAVVTLAIIIVLFLTFTSRFFDNSEDTIETSDIVSFTVAVKRLSKENIQEYLSEKININDLPKVIENAKYIFFKPRAKETSKLDIKVFIEECKKNFATIWKIMSHMPIYILIYWTMTLVLIFWFWDTFATTFLIDFLDGIAPGWSYILLAVIAIPALWLQEIAGKIAGKIWVKTVAFIGLGLSGASLIAMGIFAWGEWNWLIFISLAIINSIGYSCGMSLGQNWFLESYNKIYASSNNLTEIDANASAWPMKILQNFANVIWLMLWWVILWAFGYQGFFLIFGSIIIWALVWSIMRKDSLEI
jgi:MFS family permease